MKRHIVPYRNALRTMSNGMGIGTEFFDHRLKMVVTGIGEPFYEGNKLLFYFEAEEAQTRHATQNCSATKPKRSDN